ncbi:hypothetical protein HPB47_028195, partial [Ixodes persulcatus]
DPLERFFEKVRQAAGESDHPDMPTFPQLYRTLSIYTLLKPLKFGNSEAREEARILNFSSFKAIFKSEKGGSEQRLADIRAKLYYSIDTESWKYEEVLPADATM